jgi:hypothetical protein
VSFYFLLSYSANYSTAITMHKMNLPFFPNELKDAIVAHLGRPDIIRLSQTCRALHRYAGSAIYRDIALTWNSHGGGPAEPSQLTSLASADNPSRMCSLLRTLLQQPSYATHVKTMTFYARGDSTAVQPCLMDSSDRTLAKEKIQKLGLQDAAQWEKAVLEERDLGAVMALLLAQCSNLESLTMDVKFLAHDKDWVSAMFRHAVTASGQLQIPKFDKLSQMTVTTASTDTTETVLLPFYLPNISSLTITDMPEILGRDQKKSNDAFWPFPEEPQGAALSSLKLHSSLAAAGTLERLLHSSSNVSTLFYECYLPSSRSPLDLDMLKQGLEHVRLTLADLTIRYSLFADEALDVESLVRILTGSLGSFAAFPCLTGLHISLGVLFGQISPSDAPPLASVLPPHLQRLTIFDDLWDYNAYYEWTDGIAMMALFRVFLEGAPGEEPCWKEAVPELKVFVLDMSNNGWAVELSQEDIEDLKRMAEAQGITCEVLEPLDSDDEDDV